MKRYGSTRQDMSCTFQWNNLHHKYSVRQDRKRARREGKNSILDELFPVDNPWDDESSPPYDWWGEDDYSEYVETLTGEAHLRLLNSPNYTFIREG
jgi:hypothetical protein